MCTKSMRLHVYRMRLHVYRMRLHVYRMRLHVYVGTHLTRKCSKDMRRHPQMLQRP